MPNKRLKEFLNSYGVAFQTLPHAPTFTAAETAAAAHVPGRDLAKPVMVRLDGELAMVVVPADRMVSLEQVRRAAGAASAEMAAEKEFNDRFPDCEPGAMPAMGNLYGMKVYADRALTRDPTIAFNAGTHDELVQLSYDDFARLAAPVVGGFTELSAAGAQ